MLIRTQTYVIYVGEAGAACSHTTRRRGPSNDVVGRSVLVSCVQPCPLDPQVGRLILELVRQRLAWGSLGVVESGLVASAPQRWGSGSGGAHRGAGPGFTKANQSSSRSPEGGKGRRKKRRTRRTDEGRRATQGQATDDRGSSSIALQLSLDRIIGTLN